MLQNRAVSILGMLLVGTSLPLACGPSEQAEVRRSGGSSRSSLGLAPASDQATPHDFKLVFTGRLLAFDGSPAAGAEMQVEAYREGRSVPLSGSEGTTSTDGKIHLEVQVPAGSQVHWTATLEGHARASQGWIRPEVGSVELGEIRLLRAGTIRGRVLDQDGKPSKGGWFVSVESVFGEDRTQSDSETGEFELSHVPPGPVLVRAARYGELDIDRIRRFRVEVEPDAVRELDLRFEETDRSDRIRLRLQSATLPLTERVRLVASDGSVLRCPTNLQRAELGSKGPAVADLEFGPLEAGDYSLIIDDPRFETRIIEDLHPGDAREVSLRGSSTLELRVLDNNGESVHEYELIGVYPDLNGRRFPLQLRGSEYPEPAGGRYTGLATSNLELLVRAPGKGAARATAELRAGETTDVEVSLHPFTTLHGIVSAEGTEQPAAGARVLLRPKPESGLGLASERDFWLSQRRAEVVCDANGRFRFTGLLPGEYTLVASGNPFRMKETPIGLAEGENREVAVSLPKELLIEGRVVAPEGTSLDGFWIELQPMAYPPDAAERLFQRGPFVYPVGSDGRFRVDSLSVMWWNVSLRGPRTSHGLSYWHGAHFEGVIHGERLVRANRPGRARIDFDLRDRPPASIEFDLRIDAQPAPGAVVEVRRGQEGSCARADSSGKSIRLEGLVAGDWQVRVLRSTSEWGFNVGTVHVDPGEQKVVRLDVETSEYQIRLIDAGTGRPLAKQHVRFPNDVGRQTTDQGHLAFEWNEEQIEIEVDGALETITHRPGRQDVRID